MTIGVRFEDAEAPRGMRLYAIGDIHGRADLLRQMTDRIATEIARDRPDDWRVIYLGDYVDRGPQSAQAIDLIARLAADDPRQIALKGNHDNVFAQFLTDAGTWQEFANFDGDTTARSYGVALDFGDDASIQESHRALLASVPETHVAFLNALALSVAFGDFFFCHAGIRPEIPLDTQTPHDLMWIRREFHSYFGLHPKIIVHGHTPHDEPEVRSNRVNLDTCAFASGRLTAIAIEDKEKRFLEVVG